MSEIISVMIVDDHPMVRKGLAMFIEGHENLKLLGEAGNAESALLLYKEKKPDVVLLDMVLGNEKGTQVIKEISKINADAAIIALTSFSDDKIIEDALRAGARGFLYKNVSVRELTDAIRQVYLGNMILDQRASAIILALMNTPRQETATSNLSKREEDVLRLLIEGLTNKQIASKLNLKLSTVKQYLSKVFSKLGVQSRTEAATIAIKDGILGDS